MCVCVAQMEITCTIYDFFSSRPFERILRKQNKFH